MIIFSNKILICYYVSNCIILSFLLTVTNIHDINENDCFNNNVISENTFYKQIHIFFLNSERREKPFIFFNNIPITVIHA